METQTQQPTPILNIAWTRYAHLDAAASKRTRAFYNIRRWITMLGILATLFAVVTQLFFSDPQSSQSLPGLVVKVFFVATPILASILAAFASKFYSNGAWFIMRAGAEEIKKEIYFYRTILQKNSSRRGYLEKRLGEIQRQLYRSLSGEFAFETYDGPVPPDYSAEDPDSDSGFNDLAGESYFKYRLENQLAWHNKKVIQYKAERRRMTIFIYAAGGLGAIFAAWGQGLSLLVAITASITAALLGWQELRNVDSTIRNFSKVVMELTLLYDHWHNLEAEERTTTEFYKMVRGCEDVLWAQNTEYIKSMQDALKESDLEQEAGLINRVIKESVESDTRMKKTIEDNIVDYTKQTLVETEAKADTALKTVLGSLAEEASSEVVQQELEAMSRAVTESAQAMIKKASGLSSALEDIAKEFAHIDVGRDTTPQQLNEILSRYPKTGEVKG